MICRSFSVKSQDDVREFLSILKGRQNHLSDEANGNAGCGTESIVRDIMVRVRDNGIEAVVEYARKFDSPCFTPDMFRVSQRKAAEAARAADPEDLACIRRAADNIRAFHQEQKERSWFMPSSDGAVFGQLVRPVGRGGLYVPGGKGGATPLISSLLMNAIPAQVAGVKELAVISPPRADGTISPHILAAADFLGIEEIYAAGSAWAIAALAFGAGDLKPVDVIAGPGNIFVTTAKRLLLGSVGIDMLAGPSEILILADESANPDWLAADMLSQAEHDPQASSVCLTTSPQLAKNLLAKLEKQCRKLPRANIAEQSLKAYGAVIVVADMPLGVAISNSIAPEHLELLVDNPWDLLPLITNAGAVFLGHYSPEALGDYFAGPNHVLPTMGTARFSSALSVDTFCKKTSLIASSPTFTRKGIADIARLARLEGLEAHARSAECRIGGDVPICP